MPPQRQRACSSSQAGPWRSAPWQLWTASAAQVGQKMRRLPVVFMPWRAVPGRLGDELLAQQEEFLRRSSIYTAQVGALVSPFHPFPTTACLDCLQ